MRDRADYLENKSILLKRAKELKGYKVEFVEAAYDKDFNPINWYIVATKNDDKIVSYHFEKEIKDKLISIISDNNKIGK
ncbi:hypothetical protein [Macrococcoides canis]|uniref:hypothetical protein n=1 Tax=Macrococcoides canis TaxID=1855823 RepID=UPI00165DE576|nr:hypothetical protein [Macrococcus canis]QNR09101.1 hypothetical protein GL258_12510 [Macrococcus canis]